MLLSSLYIFQEGEERTRDITFEGKQSDRKAMMCSVHEIPSCFYTGATVLLMHRMLTEPARAGSLKPPNPGGVEEEWGCSTRSTWCKDNQTVTLSRFLFIPNT